jgi:hypothetical protein
VILDDVKVVEQPFAGGPDVYAAIGRGGESRLGGLQYPAGAIEAVQQGSAAPPPVSAVQPLAGGERMRPLVEMFGPEELSPDGTGQQVLAWVGTVSAEAGGDAERLE